MVDLDTLNIGDRVLVVKPSSDYKDYGFDISRHLGKEMEVENIDPLHPDDRNRQIRVREISDHSSFFWAMSNEIELLSDNTNTVEDWN